MTAPPCRPVAPVTRTILSLLVTLPSHLCRWVDLLCDLLQRREDLWILRLQFPIHCHVLRRILTQEDERLPNAVRIVDGLGDLLHHCLLRLRADAGRRLHEDDRHGCSPFEMGRKP